MHVDWDPEKAAANFLKHRGITFEEASSVFLDPLEYTFNDPDHSVDEMRYLTIGVSNRGRLLIVSYTERIDKIRIISARRVVRTERKIYEEV
jgi:uncharacterized DUF497 family protein